VELIKKILLGVSFLVFLGARMPPDPAPAPAPASAPVTRDELTEAIDSAQRAIKVAQLKIEMFRQQSVQPPSAPPPVTVVSQPPTEPDSVIKQVRDVVVPVFLLALTAFIGVVASNIPTAKNALNNWIQMRLAVHQQERVYAAANTAAGQIETKLDRGAITLGEVTEDNTKIRQIVADALRPVRESAEAQGANVDTVAPIVVARVDTGSRVSQKVIAPKVDSFNAPSVPRGA
jgi:hypothetical protein